MEAVFAIEKSVNFTTGPKDDYVLMGYVDVYFRWQANNVSYSIALTSNL